MFSLSSEDSAYMKALDRSLAIIHFDMNGIILWANDNFLNALGYSLSEITGQHHSLFVTNDFKQSTQYADFWSRLREGIFQSAQYKRVGKGGREVFIEATYNPVFGRNGKPYKVIKLASDITVKTVKMREAIDRTQAAISFNLDGTVIEANQNFLHVIGYSLDEIKGKHHSMFVDPAYSHSAKYQEFWAALNRGEFQAGEFERIGNGGKHIWIQASYNPIFDNTGKPVQVTKYATDITQQKMMAQQVLESTNAVATATHELSGSITDIGRSMGQTRDSVQTVSDQSAVAGVAIKDMVSTVANMGNLVGLIENISGQINLLALNATIEAARAGEAGRGFSVVADEVKKLATQTGTSTTTIAEEISRIQKISGSVSESLERITSLVQEALDGTNSVVAAIEQQSAVTNDISNNMAALTSIVNRAG
ncbi:MAG: PAS domain S-box protein [Blastochloris viridis]|uniref:PAS domain S-box protein n=1 Tax=Blastochloris viridis TaxID=1079 RepID=A0A6N4R2F7_BLAVI|nr:MAG: PAS domain S-box protein [Blastochloris viridis]